MTRTLDPAKQLVYQATAISRAAYDLSTNAKRILYAAASCIKLTDTEIPTVTMTVGDVAKALGLADNGRVYERLESAVDGLMGKVVTVYSGRSWDKFTWVSRAHFDEAAGTIEIRFHEEVRGFLLGLRNSFSVFRLRDLGRLQGAYSLRIFELVTANAGFAGQGGNEEGTWFVDLLFADLRVMFALGPTQYKATNDLRKRLVDAPVREINEADLGLRIECDYETHRRGRTLRGVRLKVKHIGRDEPIPVGPATASELEEADLATKHPERYAELVRECEAKPGLPGMKLDPEVEALGLLAAEVQAAAKPKRGRPRKPTSSRG